MDLGIPNSEKAGPLPSAPVVTQLITLDVILNFWPHLISFLLIFVHSRV